MQRSILRSKVLGALSLSLALIGCADGDPFPSEPCTGPTCLTPTDPPDAIVTASPEVIRRGDDFGTLITLDASQSTGGGLTFLWSIPDARFEEGSTPDQAVVRVRLPGTAPHSWTLTARNTLGMDAAAGEIRPNAAPIALTSSGAVVPVGEVVHLDGSQSYDPEGDALAYRWHLVRAPSGSSATLTDASSVTPTITPDVPGDYRVELAVADAFSTSAPSVVRLVAEPTDLDPPELAIQVDPSATAVGDPVSVCIVVSDASPIDAIDARIDDAPITLDATGCAAVTVAERGRHVVTATARDASRNEALARGAFYAHSGPDDGPPRVELLAPVDESVIDTQTEARGVADDSDLALRTLELAPLGSDLFTTIVEDTNAVSSGVLGTIDPRLIVAGEYRLRLCAVDDWANTACTTPILIELQGNPVPGVLALGFVDVKLEVVGVPLNIGRLYDSRDKVVRDFGVGWRMETAWKAGIEGPDDPASGWRIGGVQCVTSGGHALQSQDHVYIVRVGGDAWAFAMTLNVTGNTGTGYCGATVSYEPLATTGLPVDAFGPTAIGFDEDVFVPIDRDGLLVRGDGDPIAPLPDPSRPWRPGGFTLRLRNGTHYSFEPTRGLVSARDTAGRTYTFDTSGVSRDGTELISIHRADSGLVQEIRTFDDKVRTYRQNSAGDLIAYTDTSGVTSRFRYDPRHNLKRVIDPRGFSGGEMQYDDLGRLLGVLDDDGNPIQTIEHIDAERRTRITDALGNVTELVSDESGRPISRTTAEGTTSYTYDDNGFPSATTDPSGDTRRFDYNEAGFLEAETDPAGNTWRYGYDEAGRVLSVQDPNGGMALQRTYDADGLLQMEVNAAGGATHFAHDSRGLLTSITSPEGTAYGLSYDDDGRMIGYMRPDGVAGTTTTRADGELTSDYYEVDGRSVGYDYEYDGEGRPTSVRLPNGMTSMVAYDAAGNPSAVLDNAGLTQEVITEGSRVRAVSTPQGMTGLEYDAAGRLTRTVLPNGGELVRELDPLGRSSAVRMTGASDIDIENRPGGRPGVTRSSAGAFESRTGYNEDGTQWAERVRVADGVVVERREHDKLGRMVRETVVGRGTTNYEYDALGNPLRIAHPDGTERAAEYDREGRPTLIVDEGGRAATFTYAAGRLSALTIGGESYGVGYNGAGAISRVTLPGGAELGYRTDAAKLVLERTYPWGGARTFTRDGAGRAITEDDGAGRILEREYDAETGRVLREGSNHYEYGATGLPLRIVGPLGPTVYAYNSAAQLVRVEDAIGVVSYTYDASGKRTSISSLGRTSTFEHRETDGRLARIVSGEHVVSVDYDDAGRVSRVRSPNGTSTTYAYDHPRGLITRITVEGGATSWSERYEYDGTNRPTLVERNGRVTLYTYDDAGRVLSEETDGELTSYAYSANGDLTRIGARELTVEDLLVRGDGERTFTYDAAGKLTGVSGGGVTRSLTYDALGQLVRVESTGGGPTLVELSYNASGLLTRVTADGRVRNLQWDTTAVIPQLLAEVDGEGALIAAYIDGGPGGRIQLDGAGNLRVMQRSALGNVALVTGQDGAVVAEAEYLAFGGVKRGSALPAGLPIRFAEAYYVEELGLYAMGARFYDAGIGRFITPDPTPPRYDSPLSFHPFQYALNAPTTYTDPTGHFEFSLSGILISTAISTIVAHIAAPILQSAVNYVGSAIFGDRFTRLNYAIVGAAATVNYDISLQKLRLPLLYLSLSLDITYLRGSGRNHLGVYGTVGITAQKEYSCGGLGKKLRSPFVFSVLVGDPDGDPTAEEPYPVAELSISGSLGKVFKRAQQRNASASANTGWVIDLADALAGNVELTLTVMSPDRGIKALMDGFEVGVGLMTWANIITRYEVIHDVEAFRRINGYFRSWGGVNVSTPEQNWSVGIGVAMAFPIAHVNWGGGKPATGGVMGWFGELMDSLESNPYE